MSASKGKKPRRPRSKIERSGRRCDCGQAKAVGAYACVRCRTLECAGFTADTRPHSLRVGGKEESPQNMHLRVIDLALTRFLRERGLIDPNNFGR